MNPAEKEGALRGMTESGLKELTKSYPWFVAAHIALWRINSVAHPLPTWEALALRYRLTETPVEVPIEKISPAEETVAGPDSIEIIDRFIARGEHRIVSVPDAAEEAATEETAASMLPDGMLSEKLAEIYLSQGFTDRAVEIYERLGLLNPKKSVYFAELIDKIRKVAEQK